MTLYSPAQILGGGKIRRTTIRPQVRVRRLSAFFTFDVQLLKAAGRVWCIVLPCLFLCYSATCAMVNSVNQDVTEVENINYQLLTNNLDLRSQAKKASTVETVAMRAESLGLYEHERGQRLVYKVNKNYFSYQ